MRDLTGDELRERLRPYDQDEVTQAKRVLLSASMNMSIHPHTAVDLSLADRCIDTLVKKNTQLREQRDWLADPHNIVLGYTREENIERAEDECQ
jgi:hypothetical protein